MLFMSANFHGWPIITKKCCYGEACQSLNVNFEMDQISWTRGFLKCYGISFSMSLSRGSGLLAVIFSLILNFFLLRLILLFILLKLQEKIFSWKITQLGEEHVTQSLVLLVMNINRCLCGQGKPNGNLSLPQTMRYRVPISFKLKYYILVHTDKDRNILKRISFVLVISVDLMNSFNKWY